MSKFHTYSTTINEVVATRIIDHTETHDAKLDLGQDASYLSREINQESGPSAG